MSITTISKSNSNVLHITESYGIALGFPATQELYDGMPVKLAATGEAEKIANDGSETPIGIVVRGNQNTSVYEGEVTVLTQFKAVLVVKAQAPVTVGAPAIFHDYTAANGLEYKPGAAGNTALGVFLEDGAAGDEVRVGILKTPFTVA